MCDISNLSLDQKHVYQRVPFGKEMRKQFAFAPNFRNMNHGIETICPTIYARRILNHV